MKPRLPRIVTLSGPTACGKTALAHQILDYFADPSNILDKGNSKLAPTKLHLINIDSRLFYRGFNIGTAKPSPEELKKYNYQLVDFLNSTDEVDYTAYHYLENLDQIIQQYPNDLFLLVGGSTFYLDAVINGLPAHSPIDLKIKKKLQQEYEVKGLAPLLDEIKEKDTAFYHYVDKHNPRRILRGLEVIRSGLKFSELREQREKKNYDILSFTLMAPRNELYQRIEKRVHQMFQNGWIDEVATLLQNQQNLSKLKIIGYPEIAEYLNQPSPDLLSVIQEKIIQQTRQFSKRQITWFKKNRKGWTLFTEYNNLYKDFNLRLKSLVEINKADEWIFKNNNQSFEQLLFQENYQYPIQKVGDIIKKHYRG